MLRFKVTGELTLNCLKIESPATVLTNIWTTFPQHLASQLYARLPFPFTILSYGHFPIQIFEKCLPVRLHFQY